jgi:hypothetical protein
VNPRQQEATEKEATVIAASPNPLRVRPRRRAALDKRNQRGGHAGVNDGALGRSAAGVGLGGKREFVSVAKGTAMVLVSPLILSPWPGASPRGSTVKELGALLSTRGGCGRG